MDEMNLFTDFDSRIKNVLEGLEIVREKRADLDFSRIGVEPPRDASHGDVATNAAMVLAKPLGLNPRALADLIVAELKKDPEVADVSVAGPGFINVRLSVPYWQKLLAAIVKTGTDYGRGSLGAGRKVNVEYVSANPTGPMHVGHCRGAVVGDALANLLAFAGYGVTQASITSTTRARRSTCSRVRPSCATARRSARAIGDIPSGLYPGDYLGPVGEALAKEFGDALRRHAGATVDAHGARTRRSTR
jgi:arginyl-tRNA synthetase